MPSLMTSVGFLVPTQWKQRTKLSSGLHKHMDRDTHMSINVKEKQEGDGV